LVLLHSGSALGAEHEATASSAEGGVFESADEAARQSSNPLGGQFMILLNQIDNYFLQGDATSKTRHVNTWSLQPVVPIPMKDTLGEHWIMVNRPTLPFVMNADVPDLGGIDPGSIGGSTPPPHPGSREGGVPFTGEGGFGDMVHFSLLGQSLPQKRWGGGDLVWAVGPTFQFPTASKDELGSGKYSMGPSGVLAFIGRKFILGGLYQHWFSYADGGNGPGDRVNFSWLNLFYFLNFPGGWQVGGTPVLTADWTADSDNSITFPIGLGVYKTHFFGGKLPMKLGVEGQYMPVQPDILGQEFNIRFVIAPIVPLFFN
jgi:hypothetical protein